MLGCHDFCGYYDWTFAFVRRHFGTEALRAMWAEAIGRDAQRHYEQAGGEAGLAGLARVWERTGADEACDWTFTLDEQRNVLRWDMRQCPSKGFLLDNDCHADQDYCDHCMGWIIPLLARIGIEVTGHEHNHVGQCWGEMSVSGKTHASLDPETDIRRDPRWNRGYLHQWRNNRQLPLLGDVCASPDSLDILDAWFAQTDHLLVLGPGAAESDLRDLPLDAVLVTEAGYATPGVFAGDPVGVLLNNRPTRLAEVAERFHATPIKRRPLLMHMYLPGSEPVDFVSAGLPRPLPILPQLIRNGYGNHRPGHPYPTTDVCLVMLAISLDKKVHVVGVDVCPPPSSKSHATSL